MECKVTYKSGKPVGKTVCFLLKVTGICPGMRLYRAIKNHLNDRRKYVKKV